MEKYLSGRTIGFLVAQHGIDDLELSGPRRALDEAGATTLLVSPGIGRVATLRDGEPYASHEVDVRLSPTTGDRLDALVLPDGEANSHALRSVDAVVDLIRSFLESGRPLGVFGHAVWSLLDAGVVPGRHVTSHPGLRPQVERAGGHWLDRRVVVDANLITSRAAQDIEAFNVQLIAYLDR